MLAPNPSMELKRSTSLWGSSILVIVRLDHFGLDAKFKLGNKELQTLDGLYYSLIL